MKTITHNVDWYCLVLFLNESIWKDGISPLMSSRGAVNVPSLDCYLRREGSWVFPRMCGGDIAPGVGLMAWRRKCCGAQPEGCFGVNALPVLICLNVVQQALHRIRYCLSFPCCQKVAMKAKSWQEIHCMLWLLLQKHDCVPKFVLLSNAAMRESGINDRGASVCMEQHGGREGYALILCQSGEKPFWFQLANQYRSWNTRAAIVFLAALSSSSSNCKHLFLYIHIGKKCC